MKHLIRAAQCSLAISLVACGGPVDEATSVSAVAGDDVILEWNEIMVNTTAAVNPFFQARFAATTQLAVFEAVNAITGDYEPYLGTISAPAGASAEAAAITAAHDVLVNYLPAAAAALDAARDNSLAAIPDGQAKDDGVAVGAAAAAAMIAARTNDGSAPPQFHVPGSTDPGEWQTTPSCPPAGGVLKHWGNVATFGIESGSQFRVDAPPRLNSLWYTVNYIEVKAVGDVDSQYRPQNRSDVARFYNFASAGHLWNMAARQVSAAQGKTLSESARNFALLNMAISDGLVSSLESKYHYTFWRPETAIQNGDTDGNRWTHADPGYVPFITTPCFPSYPSAHASGSYSARGVVSTLFGRGGHSITLTHPAMPGFSLHYSRFSEITHDIDDARVFGGIHFRFDQIAGGIQGTQIAEYTRENNLQPSGAGN